MSSAPEALPERVRARVIAYAADALGALPTDQVPAALKRAASFTPQRRARIAGQQILDHLLADDTFRERLAVQARARQADVASQLDTGAASAAVAALAFLVRGEGWEDVVATVAATAEEERDVTKSWAEEVASLSTRLHAALAEQATLRQGAKDDLAAAKVEITDLRRKLGEARSSARSARTEADRRVSDADRRLAELAASAASADSEVRRLKVQVGSLEAELARTQRAARAGRDTGTLRARLLLDTLLQAAQGLRQELALPVVTGSPADQVEAHIAEEGARHSSAAASLGPDDPSLARELLGLPQVHLVVDGYNVTRADWDDTSLEAQRARLLRGLAPLAAQTGAEVTVVFDGTNAESRPLVQAPRGVRVLFSPRGVLADDVIRELVAAEPPGRPVLVVSSDQEIVRDVTRQAGVRVVGARALVRLLGG